MFPGCGLRTGNRKGILRRPFREASSTRYRKNRSARQRRRARWGFRRGSGRREGGEGLLAWIVGAVALTIAVRVVGIFAFTGVLDLLGAAEHRMREEPHEVTRMASRFRPTPIVEASNRFPQDQRNPRQGDAIALRGWAKTRLFVLRHCGRDARPTRNRTFVGGL